MTEPRSTSPPGTMRAFVFAEHGDPDVVLNLQERPVPVPGPGQVLVATLAAAVNFADHLMIKGDYQLSPALPAVGGMELAGTVVATGPGVEMPVGTLVAGTTAGLVGAFAEYAVLDGADALIPPAGFSAVEAACFTVAHQTAWFALHVRAQLASEDRVLVQAAAGGVGLATVQLAKEAGAHVVGVVGSPAKAEHATRAGCDLVLVRGRDDVVGAVKQSGSLGSMSWSTPLGDRRKRCPSESSASRAGSSSSAWHPGSRLPSDPSSSLSRTSLSWACIGGCTAPGRRGSSPGSTTGSSRPSPVLGSSRSSRTCIPSRRSPRRWPACDRERPSAALPCSSEVKDGDGAAADTRGAGDLLLA